MKSNSEEFNPVDDRFKIMTDKEILEKAIQKAIDAGFDSDRLHDEFESVLDNGKKLICPAFTKDKLAESILSEIEYECGYAQYIFNHDFAKALWGEYKSVDHMQHYIPARGYPGQNIDMDERNEHITPLAGKYGELPEYLWDCVNCKKPFAKCLNSECEITQKGNIGWQYHLQQMVISDDPIKYLGDNI